VSAKVIVSKRARKLCEEGLKLKFEYSEQTEEIGSGDEVRKLKAQRSIIARSTKNQKVIQVVCLPILNQTDWSSFPQQENFAPVGSFEGRQSED